MEIFFYRLRFIKLYTFSICSIVPVSPINFGENSFTYLPTISAESLNGSTVIKRG